MNVCKKVDEWVKLWNNYDLKQVDKLFLNDNRASYFSSEKQGIIKGIDNLIEHHKEFGFKCFRPTAPSDEDLFENYSETKKSNFLSSLKSLREDCIKTSEEKN